MLRLSIRKIAAFAAVLAITLQALWPLLSHARPKDPSMLVPVCTIDGITHYLELKSGKNPLEERSALHGEHCKLCVFSDDKAFAAVSPDVYSFLVRGGTNRKILPKQIQFPESLNHPSAQPRAPPQIS